MKEYCLEFIGDCELGKLYNSGNCNWMKLNLPETPQIGSYIIMPTGCGVDYPNGKSYYDYIEANEYEYDNESFYSLRKNDYVEYFGGSESKYLTVGKKYRLTGSPFNNYSRVAVINDIGKRQNMKSKYFRSDKNKKKVLDIQRCEEILEVRAVRYLLCPHDNYEDMDGACILLTLSEVQNKKLI